MELDGNNVEIFVIGEGKETSLLSDALSSLDYTYLCCSVNDFNRYISLNSCNPLIIFTLPEKKLCTETDKIIAEKKIRSIYYFPGLENNQKDKLNVYFPYESHAVELAIEINLVEKKYEEQHESQLAYVNDVMMQLTHSNVRGLLLSEAMKKFMQGEKIISKQGGLRKLLIEFLISLLDITRFEQTYFVRYTSEGKCKRIFDQKNNHERDGSLLLRLIGEYAEEIYTTYHNEDYIEPQLFTKNAKIDGSNVSVHAIPLRSRGKLYGITILVSMGAENLEIENIDYDVIKFLSMEIEQILERYLLNQEINKKNKAFKESNERLEYVLNSSPAVLFSLKAENFSLKFISSNVERFLGYPPDMMTSNVEFFWKLIHPDDMNKALTEFKKIHKNRGCVREYRLRCADGKYKWVHDELRLIKKSDNTSEIAGYFVDISDQVETQVALRKSNIELKSAYNSLQNAKNQLLQSEKMASIGQLAAGVAHEINNPVGYISSNLSSLSQYVNDLFSIIENYEKYSDKESSVYMNMERINKIRDELDIEFIRTDLPELLEQSQEGVARVKKIVQDLKDFSHVDSTDWQLADLHQGIDSTLNIVNNEIKYKADVIKKYDDIPQVECIASQLNQVFMNMLVNAAHAIDDRGTITIETGKNDDWVFVKFSDTGSGIEEKNIKKLFDPFFTTKPVGKGTGLGLSLSYSIIERHGGKIDIESEVGKGTTFIINIPIMQQESEQEKVA